MNRTKQLLFVFLLCFLKENIFAIDTVLLYSSGESIYSFDMHNKKESLLGTIPKGEEKWYLENVFMTNDRIYFWEKSFNFENRIEIFDTELKEIKTLKILEDEMKRLFVKDNSLYVLGEHDSQFYIKSKKIMAEENDYYLNLDDFLLDSKWKLYDFRVYENICVLKFESYNKPINKRRFAIFSMADGNKFYESNGRCFLSEKKDTILVFNDNDIFELNLVTLEKIDVGMRFNKIKNPVFYKHINNKVVIGVLKTKYSLIADFLFNSGVLYFYKFYVYDLENGMLNNKTCFSKRVIGDVIIKN